MRPHSGRERLEAFRDAGPLEAPLAAPAFARLARLAARLLDAPLALAALVDDDRLVVLGAVGPTEPVAGLADAPLPHTLCRDVVAAGVPIVVPDTRADARLRELAAPAGLRMAACLGVPIADASGAALGALVVAVEEVRAWTDADVQALVDLATQAVREIDVRLDPAAPERLLVTLEREQARLVELFALAPAFICVVRGPRHIIEFANARYRQLVGHRDLIGRSAIEAVPEFAAQGFIGHADRVLATGRPHVGERSRVRLARVPGAAAEERIVDYVFQPITGVDGTTSGVFVLGVDVTEEARAHEQLDRRDALLRETERMAAIGSWEWDAVSRVATWTDEMYRLHGVAPGAATRTTDEYVAHVHPEDRAAVRAALARALTAGEPFSADYRIVRPDGTVRSLHGRGRAETDASGRVVRLVGSCQDVTDRVRATRALAESEERHRLVQRATKDLIWDLDVASGRLELSDALFTTLRHSPSAPAASFDWWIARIHPDDRARMVASFQAALARGDEGWSEEFRFQRGDGTYADLVNRAYVLRDADGRAVRMIGAAQDVTERTTLEAQLRQAQRLEAVGRLAGGVAHDFNNLLTIISASTMFARDEVPPGGPAARELDRIDEANRRAAALTRQLLALSRRQVLRPQRLDLGRQVAALERMLRRVIGENIHIETSLAPRLWPVYADPGQIEQVLLNLVVNARDAMPAGGTVRLTTANVTIDAAAARARPGLTVGAYVSLVVEDTGVGIAPDVLPHIFEPFVTTKDSGRGAGLGLPLVYGIVKQSGGHMWVESAPGRGSTFTVLLPRDEGHATLASAPPSMSPPPGGRETVLLVEDEAPVRDALARVLARHGYRVLVATDGEDALAVWHAQEERARTGHAAATEHIDVVLTDLVMPRLGGRELAARLRAERPDVRVILMTGHAADAAGAPLTLDDGEHLLQKPIEPHELLRAVRAVMQA